MTAKQLGWALSALLVAGAAIPVAADNARRKGSGGGSSGGGSASAGARHHGGGSSASSRSNGASRSSSAGAEQRRATPRPTTGAEARHPDPGTGHGYRGRYYGYGYPYYGYGYPYYPYYGYGYPYYGYYGGWYGVPYYGFSLGFSYGDPGYAGGYYGGYDPGYRYREAGSIRTLVEPEKTKVFVDGYYAGTVDDFDGMFQRLYIGQGRHDVTFKLEGHRTHRVRVYITGDNTTKIRHKMEKGPGDETIEDLTGGVEEPPYRMSDAYPGREPEPRDPRDSQERPEARDGGALRLAVHPDDATIYINGEFYGSTQRSRIINLPAGRHHVEVVRPGRKTVERQVEIQAGRTETLAIDLERQ